MKNNYFDLLALPMILPINLSQLSLNYQQLQKQYHPDNYATASESEKMAVVQKSATINAAYQTLKDPIKAAEYRVALEVININEEQQTIHDSEFLQEQFMLREQLDEIDQVHDFERLELFYDEILKRKNQVYLQLLAYINQSNWLATKQPLYQLRYFVKLIEQIELQQEKHFDL